MTDRSLAIVGLGGVFPGASDLESFWSLVEEGRNAMKEPPADRWLLPADEAWAEKVPTPDHVASRRACFLDDFNLEDEGLRLSADMVESLDPLCRIAVKAGKMAWDGANTDNLDPRRVGVILGNIALPTEGSSALSREILGRTIEETVLGKPAEPLADPVSPLDRYVTGLPAGILAEALGLGGGAHTVDAACASSLYAIKLAADELFAGRADAMVAGGMSRADGLYTQMGFSALRALSPSGTCSPFDGRGDGLVVGEGAGMFLLKRLDDALRDEDHIHAVLRGFGLANDVGGSLLVPNSEGQLRAMRPAYKESGWSPSEVDLIECHATGTPVGDGVEVESLKQLWQDASGAPSKCVIGSVKSNVGHLLTGAGAAGLMKVVLAMKHRRLPPTANFGAPDPKHGMEESPFRVLAKSEPWERRDEVTPRRAAVSAFGFGGINAHVLVEEWDEERAPRRNRMVAVPAPVEREDVAIVGMSARFGPWQSLRAFQERVLGGDDGIEPKAPGRWGGVTESGWFKREHPEGAPLGHYMDEVEVSAHRFRVPPIELKESLPQQLLMLEAAADAVEDAGWEDDGSPRLQTGVFIGLGLDLGTTDFHLRWSLQQEAREWARELGLDLSPDELGAWIADLRDASGPPLTANRTMGALGGIVASRVARELRVGGPSFVLSGEEASGLRAVEAAMRALQQGEIETALVGAVDLAGDVRSVLATEKVRPWSRGDEARPFSEEADGALVGEGSAAIVLKRLSDALRDGDHVHGVIKGFGGAGGPVGESREPSVEAVVSAATRAFADARLEPEAVDFVEAHGSGHPAEDAAELAALAEVYGKEGSSACVIGSVKADIGHAGAAAGLASVVRACLSLEQQVLPPVRGLGTPRVELSSATRPMLLTRKAQHWLRDRQDGPRRAAVSSLGVDGSCCHLVLEACERSGTGTARADADRPDLAWPLGARREAIFAVEADDAAELLARLSSLEDFARRAGEGNIEALARTWLTTSRPLPERKRAAAFVARSADELGRQVAFAKAALRKDEQWKPADETAPAEFVRDRIFYSADPQGHAGKLAFVFPGSGNQYPGMGRQLALEWPEILRKQDADNLRLRSQVVPELTWSSQDPKALAADARAAVFGQVGLGTLLADLLRSFGVEPKAVLGYSLGETMGMVAMHTWRRRDEMLRRMEASTLFVSDLSGPCDAARRCFGLPDGQAVEWSIGVVDRPADVVREAVESIERAYLLIVNTRRECVVGGERRAVQELISALGCAFLPLEGVVTVHCEAVEPVAHEWHDLHLLETTPPAGVDFYSAAWARKYDVDEVSVADSITEGAQKGFDFPELVEQAHADGVRVFVEVGPGGSCSRMVASILGDKPHFTRATVGKGQDEVSSLLRLLASLVAERIPVDLERVHGQESLALGLRDEPEDPKGLSFEVPVGRSPFVAPPLPVHVEAPVAAAPTLAPARPQPQPAAPMAAAPSVQPIAAAPQQLPPPPPMAAPAAPLPPVATNGNGVPMALDSVSAAATARAEAHGAWLRLNAEMMESLTQQISMQTQLAQALAGVPGASVPDLSVGHAQPATAHATLPQATAPIAPVPPAPRSVSTPTGEPPRVFDRDRCMEFAIGSIGRAMGPRFAAVDAHPTRVRLPDEPLMLVDRILDVEGEPLSMTTGRVVTEHDIHEGAWYLDGNTIPTCIAVEAGQADLFLSGWLGIDFETKGLACYRLLDAEVTFHGPLPGPGETIHYDIRIERFFRQGDTWLFRFNYDGTVNGRPLITMRKGCAGFFSQAELDAGKGIVHSKLDMRERKGILPAGWRHFVAMPTGKGESYNEAQLAALRAGDLATCFGPAFAGLPLANPRTLPDGRMNLVHRVNELSCEGGRYGIGYIKAEADIHPDDWFLTCHFSDDKVMPGTLMYECCLHVLRIFLMRMGWVGEHHEQALHPVLELPGILKCRGQVLDTSKLVTYEINPKEFGFEPEPFVIVDALMYCDGKPIVEITDMSVRMVGLSVEGLDAMWAGQGAAAAALPAPVAAEASGSVVYDQRPAVYDKASIMAFSNGKPSEAFGDRYLPFDEGRKIARLPGPPYQFLDRVVEVTGEPWVLKAGAACVAQYDIPPDEWYFASAHQPLMPFAVLLEIALQPCGWLAGYCGSALTSETDIKFRNLGGNGIQHRDIGPNSGTLTIAVKMTRVSSSGGMIIQGYDMVVSDAAGPVYEGDTYFGFFSKDALSEQVGMPDAPLHQPTAEEQSRGRSFAFPREAPFPDDHLRMLDEVELWDPQGGPKGQGFILGSLAVNPGAWFFAAHFFEDPVCPGSLGLESFLQLLQVAAVERWGAPGEGGRLQSVAVGRKHSWGYRGQIIPSDDKVSVQAEITAWDDEQRVVTANGWLVVDGRIIYQMTDFTLQWIAGRT